MNHIIAICGDSGSGKTTMAEMLSKSLPDSSVVECDKYHKWERSDYHWKYHTHLNPLSNNIDAMCSDLEALQNGKSVFRPDYDHYTGKFTEPKEISPSQFIIACGLHAAHFTPLRGVKIFIDTQDDLKMLWKIHRDFTERGYRIRDIIKRIEQRQIDYENHIQPQQNKCDIIFRMEYTPEKGYRRMIFLNLKHGFDAKPSEEYENFYLTFSTEKDLPEIINKIINETI